MKKNDVNGNYIPINLIRILKVMKLCVLFVIVLNFSAIAETFAQKRVSLVMKDAELGQVFKKLKQQTGLNFFYNEEILRSEGLRQVDIRDLQLEEALLKILENTGLTYTFLKGVVVIKKRENASLAEQIANKRQVSGVVKDEDGIAISGASVLVKGTQTGVATDINGDFNLLVEDKAGLVLQISFVGKKTKEVEVGNNRLEVVLVSIAEGLNEVVVTGYQTISKERATGSYTVLTPNDMSGKLQTNILDRLEGLVPGMVSYRGNTQIRGVSTINGETKPLYVVDGVPFEGDLSMINPSDVVNITVLKDATAASIYGARSANGVVVITTKRGNVGKLQVIYNGMVKFTPLPDRDYENLMSSAEFVDFQVATFNAYHNPYISTSKRASNNLVYDALYRNEGKELSDADLKSTLDKYRNQDNYDQIVSEFLRKWKITHQHSLSFRGGSDFYQYMLSLNYQGDSPYERAQHTEKVGFNLKNMFQFTTWLKADIGILGNQIKEEYSNGVLGMGLQNGGAASYYMLRDVDGNPEQWYKEKSQYELDRLMGIGLLNQSYYPGNELNKARYSYKEQYVNLNINLTVKLMEGLSVDLRYQTEKGNIYSKQYYTKNSWFVKNMVNNAAQLKNETIKYNIPIGGQVREVNEWRSSYTLRAQANYARTFEDVHDVNVIIGGERRRVAQESSGQYRVGYDDDNLMYKEINEAELGNPIYGTQALHGNYYYNVNRPKFTSVENRYISFYGNASYTYNRRLSASVSVRMDQSNLFGTDPKYQYKPLWSTGLQYVIFEDKSSWLGRLSARVTYGINGNISKKGGPYLIAKANARGNYLLNEQFTSISTPPNAGLRWEKTRVTNVGLDFQLLGHRLNGSLEYYSKSTSDLLGNRDADPTLGWTSVVMNYGDMRNRGIELSLHSKNISYNHFSWTSDFVFGYNKNKITNIKSNLQYASSFYASPRAIEGRPFNALFSLRYAGLNETGQPTVYNVNNEVKKSPNDLTKNDVVYSGTYDPVYNGSFTNTFSYKGLDLSLMFVYYGGHVLRDVEAGMYLTSPHSAYQVNMDRDNLNYWKTPADSKKSHMHPAYKYNAGMGADELWMAADTHIQKGDFIKLRDLTVGYTLPSEWLKSCRIQRVKFDFQIQNVWRWAANDKNLDPEVWQGGDIYSINRGKLTPTTYTLGLSINF